MERTAWTNERLDDLAESVRSGFARVDHDVRDLRGEISDLRDEIHQGFAELRASIQRTHLTLIFGLIGVVATILARGA